MDLNRLTLKVDAQLVIMGIVFEKLDAVPVIKAKSQGLRSYRPDSSLQRRPRPGRGNHRSPTQHGTC